MGDLTVQEAISDNPAQILPVKEIMESSYLDYAISVIVGRALPDARDGLKPVHRRILYAMHSLNIGPNSPHKKSARVVGDVIGKYHPHGDSAVYEAAVRMAQPWTMQHPLIDGQGNFGSMDGDSAAAMRYTEMKMARMGAQMFTDIGKNTVDFRPNYDGTESEPEVLPVSYPNLWVNGSEGIAVGMATSIPPHNLGETIDAYLAWVENPEITIAEIAKIMPAPDFPTGGLVHGLDGYVDALHTGRGKVKVRGRWHEEQGRGGKKRIVFTEIPYLVNKARLVEQIANLVQEKTIEGIQDLRDESNKKGIRIVLDLKKGYEAELIAIQLVAQTDLETSFNYNVRALVGQKPKQMGILDIFTVFNRHRISVIQRRTQFDLDKTMARLHILEGFLKALDRLDETIATIRASKQATEAREALQALLDIDEAQAQAILDMKLQRLTGMEIQDIRDEHKKLSDLAEDLRDILASDTRQVEIMKDEILRTRDQFAVERRSELAMHLSEVTHEDLIKEEDVVIIATQKGYLKRLPVAALNRQNRGTKGRSIIDVGEDDFVTAIHMASTHEYLMIVTDKGQVHAVKAHQIPETGIGSKGRHFRNVFEGMDAEAHVVAILSVSDINSEQESLVIATEQGLVKRTALSSFTGALRRNGVVGITLGEDDAIVAARISHDDSDRVVMVGSHSRSCCFEMGTVRSVGRTSRGVRGIKLPEDDIVLAFDVVPESKVDETFLVCIGKSGVGKKTALSEFPTKGRAGKGMLCFNPNRKSGPLAAATMITEGKDLIIFNGEGGGNRVSGSDVNESARSTTGTMLMRNGEVSDILAVPAQEDIEPETEGEE
jgi:DNA gyrase subunit A